MDASRPDKTDLMGWPSSLPSTPLCEPFCPVPLMLANTYRGGIALQDYWVSEKLDGVRGLWDGERLWTRQGHRVHPPAWFTQGWPSVAMDGELWGGRGTFDRTSATVRRECAEATEWRELKFRVFDLPREPGFFTHRLQTLTALLEKHPSPWLERVEQFKVADEAELHEKLQAIAAQGGEGLMLHRGTSLYYPERSNSLLKLKPHEEGEARVIAHLPGKGKFKGCIGALWVETPDKLRFRIGGGLTYRAHRQPPPVGSWIAYSYNGLTPRGVPRFARFMRICSEPPPAAAEALSMPGPAGPEGGPQFSLF